MKILLVTHYFSTHGGGVEIVANQLARHLLQLNPNLHIVWLASNADSPPPATARLQFRPMRAWNGIEKKTGVPCPIWSLRSLRHLWFEIKKCDAVHLHDYAYSGNVAAAIFCGLQKKPYIVTQHIGFVPFKQKPLQWLLEYSNRFLGRAILNRAQQVFFISQQVRSYFQKRGVCERTQLVPNGVNAEIFRAINNSQKIAVRTRNNIASSRPVVLFVGRFVEKKGLPFLLDIAVQRAQYQWIFAGHGPLDPEKILPSLPSHIQVLRDRSGTQIAELYQAADLLVLPSVGEGFPLVVQEALACGTPVLVESALGTALPDAASHMNLEALGKPDDQRRWMKRMDEILLNPETETQRGERAAWAAEMWNWEKGAQYYMRVLNKMLKNKHAH